QMGTYAWQSVNYPDRFIRHRNYLGFIEPINDRQAAKDAVFKVQFGLARGCYSFESKNFPGFYLRHENFRIKLSNLDRFGQPLNLLTSNERDRMDATFCPYTALAPQNAIAWSFEACCFFQKWWLSSIWDVFADDTSKKDATFNLMQPTFPFRPVPGP